MFEFFETKIGFDFSLGQKVVFLAFCFYFFQFSLGHLSQSFIHIWFQFIISFARETFAIEVCFNLGFM